MSTGSGGYTVAPYSVVIRKQELDCSLLTKPPPKPPQPPTSAIHQFQLLPPPPLPPSPSQMRDEQQKQEPQKQQQHQIQQSQFLGVSRDFSFVAPQTSTGKLQRHSTLMIA